MPIDVQSINLLVVLLICFRFYVGRKAMFDSDFKSGLYFVFSFFLLVFRVRDTRMTQLMRFLHAVFRKIHLACDLLWKVSCSNPSSQRTQLKMSEIGVKKIFSFSNNYTFNRKQGIKKSPGLLKNNNNSNNNNNNNNRIQRLNLRFLTISSLRCKLSLTCMLKSHATHIGLLSHATCRVACHMVQRDRSAIKTEFEFHSF